MRSKIKKYYSQFLLAIMLVVSSNTFAIKEFQEVMKQLKNFQSWSACIKKPNGYECKLEKKKCFELGIKGEMSKAFSCASPVIINPLKTTKSNCNFLSESFDKSLCQQDIYYCKIQAFSSPQDEGYEERCFQYGVALNLIEGDSSLFDSLEAVNETSTCCSGGLCKIKDEAETCSSIENTFLNESSTLKENESVFSLLDTVAKMTSSPDASLYKIEKSSCSKCWKNIFKAMPDSEKTTFEKSKKELLEDLADKKLQNLRRTFTENSIMYSVMQFYGYEDHKFSERKLSKKEEIGVNCIEFHKEKDANSCLVKENITDEGFSSNNYIDRAKEVYKDWYETQKLDSFRGESGVNRVLNLVKDVYEKTNENIKKKSSNEMLQYCLNVNQGVLEFDKYALIEKMLRVKLGTEPTEEDFIGIQNSIAANPSLVNLVLSENAICSIITQKSFDPDYMIATIFNIDKKIISTNMCGNIQDFEQVYCNEPRGAAEFDMSPAEFEKLDNKQKVSANALICSGKIKLDEETFEASNFKDRPGEKVQKIYNTITGGPSEANEQLAIQGQRFLEQEDSTRQPGLYNAFQTAVQQGVIGNGEQIEKSLEESRIDPINRMNEPSSLDKMIANVKSAFNPTEYSLNSSASSSTNISDMDIAQVITSNPIFEKKVEEVTDSIESVAVEENLDIENPNQALFDYLKGKETKETKALKNSSLSKEIEELKKQLLAQKAEEKKQEVASSSVELDAAKARIKNLEDMLKNIQTDNNLKNTNFGNSQFTQSGDSKNYSVSFNPEAGSQGRSIASIQGLDGQNQIITSNNGLPVNVGNNIQKLATEGLIYKNKSLALVVGTSSYPLDIKEVIVQDGVLSKIKVEQSPGKIIELKISELNTESRKAVDEYLVAKGENVLKREVASLAKLEVEHQVLESSYKEFVCSMDDQLQICQ